MQFNYKKCLPVQMQDNLDWSYQILRSMRLWPCAKFQRYRNRDKIFIKVIIFLAQMVLRLSISLKSSSRTVNNDNVTSSVGMLSLKSSWTFVNDGNIPSLDIIVHVKSSKSIKCVITINYIPSWNDILPVMETYDSCQMPWKSCTEIIMIHTFQTLDYLSIGHVDALSHSIRYSKK